MADTFTELFAEYDCRIVIEPSLIAMAKTLVEGIGFGGRQLLAVCDRATHAALGERIVRELGARIFLLGGVPHADMTNVEVIRSHKADALIAIGGGTISDLCKYASFLDGRSYVVFPTAPSMNGYFSANASITVNDHKLSLPAHLPKGIFCDLGVLANAPRRLVLSGLGDSLCRPTAQADWLLSHLLFNTPYDPTPFSLLAPYEKELFFHSGKLLSADVKVTELLMQTLLVSGLGMVIAGGSYPASQGEHLIAHTMEMKHGATLPQTYHGEQIGVCTLMMVEIQQRMLSQRLHLQKLNNPDEIIAGYFGGALSASVSKSYQDKRTLYDHCDAINERLKSEDSAIRDAIHAVSLPETLLRKVLVQAQAPAGAHDLGWKENDMQQAIIHAKFIRNRFTFLDILGNN